MKYTLAMLVALILGSCSTLKIKDRQYKTTEATVEIGSIGFSKSAIGENSFTSHVFADLDNKLRVAVSIVPFTKKSNRVYQKKARFNQSQTTLEYVDSVKTKPELVTISLLDIAGFVNQINNQRNKTAADFLKSTQKAKIVTAIVTTLSSDNISKIKQADTYYIINNQQSKYVLALYKANTKTETIDLQSGVVLGYELSNGCWSMDDKGKWYLADLIDEHSACRGKTESKIKERKTTKSLYRM